VEDFPPREPGRIISLREKLMSPAKKFDGAESLKRYEAKLAKAERNREKLLQSKFNRYVELSERVSIYYLTVSNSSSVHLVMF
jgi:hypothetical protein